MVPMVVVCAVLVLGGVAAFAEESLQPVDFTHSHNVVDAPAPVAGAVFGAGPKVKTGTAICTTMLSTAAENVNTDCAPTAGPHNETSIAVNPTDATNIIGGANDYQLGLNPGGHVTQSVLSRAHGRHPVLAPGLLRDEVRSASVSSGRRTR
jgi:hypothetical protein